MNNQICCIKSIITVCFLFLLPIVHAQEKIFLIPKENNGFLSQPAGRNDTVIIAEDHCWIVSDKTFLAYEKIKENYLRCISEYKDDVEKTAREFSHFDTSLKRINDLITEQTSVTDTLFMRSKHELQQVLENLNNQLLRLQSVHTAIEEATAKLNAIEQEIRKERRRQFYRRLIDISVASISGIIIGALVF